MASELEWEVDQSALHKRSWQWAGLKLQPFTRLLNTPEGLVYRSLLMVASNLWVSFLKFSFSEKTTKFEVNLQIILMLLVLLSKDWEIFFSNFVAFSEKLNFTDTTFIKHRSRALKSRSKLWAAIGLGAAFGKIILHQNSSLCTLIFREKVVTLAKSRGS